eukprot:m.157905 g.157905  ORF g.157905 m.157905 type:complete len:252 (-) comp10238_c0_seq8:442-1197(-)
MFRPQHGQGAPQSGPQKAGLCTNTTAPMGDRYTAYASICNEMLNCELEDLEILLKAAGIRRRWRSPSAAVQLLEQDGVMSNESVAGLITLIKSQKIAVGRVLRLAEDFEHTYGPAAQGGQHPRPAAAAPAANAAPAVAPQTSYQNVGVVGSSFGGFAQTGDVNIGNHTEHHTHHHYTQATAPPASGPETAPAHDNPVHASPAAASAAHSGPTTRAGSRQLMSFPSLLHQSVAHVLCLLVCMFSYLCSCSGE